MHLVTLKPGQALVARCPSCKSLLTINSNKQKAAVKVAFNHPKQAFNAICPDCKKDFLWSPEELQSQEIPKA